MGDQFVSHFQDPAERQQFTKCLLNDIRSLEHMLKHNMFEDEPIRIGAEQELVLVGADWMPALTYDKILKDIDDPAFTTELGRFNLEINLDPLEFKGDAFTELQNTLEAKLHNARVIAEKYNTRILLAGILPTITRSHLTFDHMTPNPRYRMLNDLIRGVRKANFELNIVGVDELLTAHENILFEACNTSFQVHLQIKQDEFVSRYNWAQAIAGPILAATANSPLLMGRRLWRETRVALFQQSIDMRNTSIVQRDVEPRVSFGKDWLYHSVAELYQDNITRFNTLFANETEEDSHELLKSGVVPDLKALCLHNGTVYMWNRPCYGVSGTGKPHLRIENRYIASGPTVIDEIANSAFWLGAMMGMPRELKNINQLMNFEDVRFNFYNAAQLGLDANFKWFGKTKSAKDLLLTKIIPWAYEGLQIMGIDQHDIDRLLTIIVTRVREKKNGARWTHRNFTSLLKNSNKDEASVGITRALYNFSMGGDPVHAWPNLEVDLSDSHNHFYMVRQIMHTDIATAMEDDLLDLVINMMVWRNVRYVMVENHNHELVGLVASRQLVKLLKEGWKDGLTVQEIMETKLVTISPDTPTSDAIEIMAKKNIGCLPVVSEDRLIGLVTERIIVNATAMTKKFKREW